MVFDNAGKKSLGLRVGDRLLDLTQLEPNQPADVADVLRQGPNELDRLAGLAGGAPKNAWRPAGDVALLPPTMRVGKIICLGLNYIDHAAEAGLQKPDYPVVFLRAATSLVGHGHPMMRPRCSDKLDYEGELVAFIGKTGRHITRDEALSHIAGYSVFNDGSIRDYQTRTPQWTVGKNFDGTGGFGPEFVSADELPPGAKGLTIQTRLNGHLVQDAKTDDMVFDVAETVALLSECMTLEVGDLLVMGTPSGIGAVRKPPLWMKPGDICEVSIERLGVLRNPIAQEA
ncbi:fumarylacetoacetate hydrolase family protein [Bradyrhizobium sp. Ash2021]|uniref:fumarylacetoacetate hydrolase family protein n=1 Tax=Bradyrhizobium sp. Ash2021 TaxID=2954771 RepID=UPI002814B921|nr:fumarylacetoacetate hydrolase family protein [Bradyrhizobium sp. Ash2021]WMT76444.1 fumarylacetoacetate hydrolase family protein [Bradyrhizobium sp. Ash2021]